MLSNLAWWGASLMAIIGVINAVSGYLEESASDALRARVRASLELGPDHWTDLTSRTIARAFEILMTRGGRVSGTTALTLVLAAWLLPFGFWIRTANLRLSSEDVDPVKKMTLYAVATVMLAVATHAMTRSTLKAFGRFNAYTIHGHKLQRQLRRAGKWSELGAPFNTAFCWLGIISFLVYVAGFMAPLDGYFNPFPSANGTGTSSLAETVFTLLFYPILIQSFWPLTLIVSNVVARRKASAKALFAATQFAISNDKEFRAIGFAAIILAAMAYLLILPVVVLL